MFKLKIVPSVIKDFLLSRCEHGTRPGHVPLLQRGWQEVRPFTKEVVRLLNGQMWADILGQTSLLEPLPSSGESHCLRG